MERRFFIELVFSESLDLSLAKVALLEKLHGANERRLDETALGRQRIHCKVRMTGG